MGLLNLFAKSPPALMRLPSGSFSVDREGNVIIGTLPSSFPADHVADIAHMVLAVFRDAAMAHLPLSELSVSYPSLKITAREMRGGAIIFLSPTSPLMAINHKESSSI